MLTFAELVFWISLAVALLAVAALFKARIHLRSFEGTLKKLSRTVPDANPFSVKTALGKAAAEYTELFSTCAARNTLGDFRVELACAPVQGQIALLTAIPRNLTGVVILCSLLVTLFNLQGAVGALGESFLGLAAGQASTNQGKAAREVQMIQQSMGNIAQTAHSAFLRSGQLIFIATGILGFSIILQKRGQQSFMQFLGWANSAYFDALSRRPTDQLSQVDQFNRLIEKLDLVGSSMAVAGDLGSKLDASSAIVADAVSKLPESINASVVQLSAKVTTDISANLQHQIEHLKKILAIYGDQESRVRNIQSSLDEVSEAMKESTKTIGSLKALPEVIESLNTTITTTRQTMAEGTKNLTKRLRDLPVTPAEEPRSRGESRPRRGPQEPAAANVNPEVARAATGQGSPVDRAGQIRGGQGAAGYDLPSAEPALGDAIPQARSASAGAARAPAAPRESWTNQPSEWRQPRPRTDPPKTRVERIYGTLRNLIRRRG
jgi:hypothetical protein